MSLLFSVLLLYNRRGDFYNKVKRKSTGAELMTIKEIAKLAQVSSAASSVEIVDHAGKADMMEADVGG